MPAAVTNIGKIFGSAAAPRSTARYPAIVLIAESASIDWAREMRGINSIEKAVTRWLARRRATSGRSNGLRKPISTEPLCRDSISCSDGGCTLMTTSARDSTASASSLPPAAT